jgi:hypothetical protein
MRKIDFVFSFFLLVIVVIALIVIVMLPFLASTRFTDETYAQNTLYRETHSLREYIYCQRKRIKTSIPLNSLLYIVEMNNSTNQILGVGLIKNFIVTDKFYKVYSSTDFNLYTYKTLYRLDREELVGYNSDLVCALETICFKGKTHLKRIPGISIIPDKLLQVFSHISFVRELNQAFSIKYSELSALGSNGKEATSHYDF